MFPAKGLWASGAHAKPAACSHGPGKPCAESGPSADAHEGLGWPCPGRVRLPLAAESPRPKQTRPLPAAPAQRGSSSSPKWPGSLPWCPVLGAATSFPILSLNQYSCFSVGECWVELRSAGPSTPRVCVLRKGVCVSFDIWVSTALCSAPSDCSVTQGPWSGDAEVPRSSCLVVPSGVCVFWKASRILSLAAVDLTFLICSVRVCRAGYGKPLSCLPRAPRLSSYVRSELEPRSSWRHCCPRFLCPTCRVSPHGRLQLHRSVDCLL